MGWILIILSEKLKARLLQYSESDAADKTVDKTVDFLIEEFINPQHIRGKENRGGKLG